jgi:NitT/TauT family transport system ATP-binding protein
LKLLAGLLAPTAGDIRFEGAALEGAPRSAMVFQEHGLFPWMDVLDNVAFGLEMRGVPRPRREARALDFLNQFGIDAFARHYPHQLSVGMRQRAALARAFLSDAPLLLMDEPFSALDAQSKLVLQQELLRIWRDHRKLVVYVTHDIEEAILLGDRVLVMTGRPGRIREEIPVPLARPRDLRDRDQRAVREITWHIWQAIEVQVRQSLEMPAPGTLNS